MVALTFGGVGFFLGIKYSENQARGYLHPGLQWRFSEAASRGDLNEMKRLFTQGAQINAEPFNGYFSGFPASVCAASGGHSHVVEWLIENGADVSLSPNDTPLDVATYRLKEAEKTINILKAHGAK